MTRNERLLVRAMEEAAEFIQRCSKQLEYGKDEIQEGQPLTNAQRTADEFEDLVVIVGMLIDEHELPNMFAEFRNEGLEAKKAKVERWMKYADEVHQSKNPDL